MATHLRYLYNSGLLGSRMLCSSNNGLLVQQVASFKNFPQPPSYEHINLPEERQRLKFLLKTPQYVGVRAPKYSKRLDLVRGFEEINNEFWHNQYGVISLAGGWLEWGHIEMIRNTLGRKLDSRKMLAHWRIESPWLPITKKGTGKRMGGGKAGINRYVYPIKPDRVIFEVTGKCSFKEVEPFLSMIANNLPFEAEAISAEKLAEKRKKRAIIEASNINPLSFKYAIQNNLLGCERWVGKMEKIYFGKTV